MAERRYAAFCSKCENERALSRSVVLSGKIPVCECGQYMNVYALDPRPPAPPRPKEASRADA